MVPTQSEWKGLKKPNFLKGTFDVSFERVQKKLSDREAGFLLMSDSSEG